MKTVWITKYALSSGVLKEDARIIPREGNEKGYASTKSAFTADYELTKEKAIERVLEMIKGERKSLAKQLAKLEKMEDDLILGELPIRGSK